MSKDLDALLSGARPPGLYRIDASLEPETVQAAAAERGWRTFHMDGREITDKASFIRTVGVALDFPAYSASNWDAFEESIRDLSWARAPGYVLVFDDPDPLIASDAATWATARSILESAVQHWQSLGVPMTVLFRKAGRALPDVPWL